MESIDRTSSTDSNASVELGDYTFCSAHGQEACTECNVDFREDNSFVAGIDAPGDRESIHADYTLNKDGQPQCKKHKTTMCSSCFAFKKQILKGAREASKAAKKAPKSGSNF
ncbi:hypothetical protein OIV83_004968 [Microbotryomycetes sp. JL201]|nr:hypothetical protein OIV83_004968 [Microbotryomycetes sp. JL201]